MKLTPDYIVGLVDGEGSFTVYVRDPESSKIVKRRVKVEPRFYLKLVERDKEILYTLMEYFGCGNVYYQPDKRANHQNCYRYEVANRLQLEQIIIPFFKIHQPKLASKRIDFEIFCELLQLINSGSHLTASGWQQIFDIKQRMH
ncbi:MAG: LAGLIDADG family homing endonuclease [Candidatus Paceibacterota bacterium]|jgi:hypothetical protein